MSLGSQNLFIAKHPCLGQTTELEAGPSARPQCWRCGAQAATALLRMCPMTLEQLEKSQGHSGSGRREAVQRRAVGTEWSGQAWHPELGGDSALRQAEARGCMADVGRAKQDHPVPAPELPPLCCLPPYTLPVSQTLTPACIPR